MNRQPREQQSEDKRKGSGRKARVPLNAMQQKMQVKHKNPNFVDRWFNDDHGRLQAAQQAGYEFVEDEDVKAERAGTNAESDARVSIHAGTRRDGSPMNAYLMRIPKEYYDEDQAAKQAVVDETDKAIRGGSIAADDPEHRYVPKDGISIKRAARG